MNQGTRRTKQKAPQENNTLIRALIVVFGAVAVALAGFLVWSLATGGASTSTSSGTPNVTPEVSGAPKLKVNHETIDLGEIKLGKTIQTVFALSNAGDQPLRITQAPYIEVVEGC